MKHSHKLLSLLLCCCLLLAALPAAVSAEDPSLSDVTFFYDVLNHEAKHIVITGVDGPLPEQLTIPSKINGYEVKEIGWNAFENREEIKELTIPEGVVRICGYAFLNCVNLQTVTLPDSVRFIEEGAFLGCSSLKTVSLPQLEFLGESAFEECAALESVTFTGPVHRIDNFAFASCATLPEIELPEGCESIGVQVFFGCSSLKTVSFPDSLHGIEELAFEDCTALEALHLPPQIDFIQQEAFVNCASLKEITISPDNPFYTVENNMLFNKDKGVLLVYPCGSEATSFTVPDSVHHIDNKGVFKGSPLKELNLNHVDTLAPGALSRSEISKITKAKDNGNFIIKDNVLYNGEDWALVAYPGGLTAASFTVPEHIWDIDPLAFAEQKYLKHITLPKGMEQIMYEAFAESALTEITIPDAAFRILDSGVFRGCESLKTVKLPKGISAIPYQTFHSCTALESVNIPDNVTSIDDYAFFRCASLKKVTLPEGLEAIGYLAFYRCPLPASLKIPATVTYLDGFAFQGTPWFDAQPDGPIYVNKILYHYKGEMPENTVFTVKEGTESIASDAFDWYWNLTDVVVPDSVTYVGRHAFEGTRWYEERLPEGPVYIGKAFYGYKGEVPGGAFTVREGTVSVTPGATGNFAGVTKLALPASLQNINIDDLHELRDTAAFTVAADSKTFAAAEGVLFTKDMTTLLAYPPAKKDKAYEVPRETETIRYEAFFHNDKLETLTVHNTLKEAYNAVEDCPALKDVFYGGVRRTWDETAGSYDLLRNGAQLHITHEDVFRDEGQFLIAAPGTRAGDVIFSLNDGKWLPIDRPDGKSVMHDEEICSGMVVTRADGKKATIALLGDTDGDGEFTSADARNALRYSVKLDDPAPWQLAAARVSGEENVTSADARLILRASVRLEDPNGWFCAA